MKSLKLLLALCSVALLAAPAYASSSLPFHGSLYQASGAAVVARGSTGALAISNIGSSGNDGVSFDCSHMDGMSLSLAGQTGPSDAGLSQTFTYSWTLVSRPQGSHASLSSARTSDGWDLNCDLSSFASPASVHAKLYLAGQLVADKVGTYQLSVVARDASGALYNPKEYAFLSRATSSVHAGLHFPVTVRVQLADGTTQDCDDVDFVCALSETDKDCDGASCDLRLTSPPASPPRSLDCVDATCRTHEGSIEYDIAGIGNSRVKVRFPWLSGADRLGRPAINTALFSGDDGFVISSNPLYSDPGLGGSNPLAKGGSSGPVRFVTSPSGLAFDLARDQGAGVTLTIQGDNFSASHTRTYTAGRFALDIDGGQLRMQHSATLYPTAPESAAVLSHGVEVARYRLQSGFVYMVQASAPGVAAKLVEVASAGLKPSWNVKANVKAAPARAGRTSAESPMVLTPQLMP